MAIVLADASTPRPDARGRAVEVAAGPERLREHMAATYFSLRLGLVVIALLLPVVLPIVAALWPDLAAAANLAGAGAIRGSLSAYYYAGDPARNVFVAGLVAVGALLYLYKGFSRAENVALNLAGLFVTVVAMVPTCDGACPPVTVHRAAAVLFFLAIAYVCLFRAPDTLTLLEHDPAAAARYRRTYRVIGALMVLSPAAAILVATVLQRPGGQSTRVFFVETFGVWVFGAYWAAKSLELRRTSAERLALAGRAERVQVPEAGRADAAGVVPAT
jgi:hypothetical protein